jgi:hypothetical protein
MLMNRIASFGTQLVVLVNANSSAIRARHIHEGVSWLLKMLMDILRYRQNKLGQSTIMEKPY